MKSSRHKSNSGSDQFEGYPVWKKEERVERLKQCFAMLPISTLEAICGKNAVVKVAVALHCQATMQGRITKIVPYTAWRKALGISKRTFFRAIATLVSKHLLRRHDRGSGRKAVIELLGPLAQFPQTSKLKRSNTGHAQSTQIEQFGQVDVWTHIGDPNGTRPA